MPLPEVQPAPEPVGSPASTSKPPSRAPRPQSQAAKDAPKADSKVEPVADVPANPPVVPAPAPTPQLRMPEGNDAAATARQARDDDRAYPSRAQRASIPRDELGLQKALTDAKRSPRRQKRRSTPAMSCSGRSWPRKPSPWPKSFRARNHSQLIGRLGKILAPILRANCQYLACCPKIGHNM